MAEKEKRSRELEQEVEALGVELRGLGPVMRGSVVELETKCGNKNCKCARGELHRQAYFSAKVEGKTRLVFLGRRRLPEAELYVGNHRRMQELVERMTLAYMELLKLKYARTGGKATQPGGRQAAPDSVAVESTPSGKAPKKPKRGKLSTGE